MHNLLADPVVGLLYLCFLFALAKFVSGSFRAWLNGVFEVTALKAWISEEGNHLVPIVLWVLLSKAIGLVDLGAIGTTFGIPSDTLTALGGGGLLIFAGVQAASYLVSTGKEVMDNLNPPDPAKMAAKVEKAAAAGDPIPGSNPVPPTP